MYYGLPSLKVLQLTESLHHGTGADRWPERLKPQRSKARLLARSVCLMLVLAEAGAGRCIGFLVLLYYTIVRTLASYDRTR